MRDRMSSASAREVSETLSLQHNETSIAIATELLRTLSERGWTCATAESCTGGLIGATMTAIPGSSGAYRGGVVAYANAAKVQLLGVPPAFLDAHGAVSAAVARAMALGVRDRLDADVAVAVTGIAGPGGGGPGKPVGLVWLSCATAERSRVARHVFPGDRAAVRRAATDAALAMALATVGDTVIR